MKKFILMLILTIILPSFNGSKPKVLLFIQDNSADLGFMLKNEVEKMQAMLEQSGFEVVIATISGEIIKAESIIVKPDIKLGEVDTREFLGLIIPCMAPNDTIVTSGEKSLVKKFVNERKPVAAQTSAVVILAKSGVLNGKKYAFPKNNMLSPDMFAEFKSGVYSGAGIVEDNKLITSATCPLESKMTGMKDGSTDLTSKLIQLINAKN